jgi:HEPN superfamily RiboL-PSP-like protein
MQAAIDQFCENLARARSLAGLAQSLSSLTTAAVDLSDILRASLVLAVSALDHFVHEFARLGMLEVHRGHRPTTDAYLSFRVPMSAAREGMADTSRDEWLDQAIREAHSWLSFQHPDKIADAIRFMSNVRLWEQVASELGMTSRTVRAQLGAIIDRRNKIAHEADMDPTNPGLRWPINEALVRDAIDFIEKMAQAMFKVA